ESGEGIFVLKLIKGGEEPRPIVSRLSDYRKSGETFTPIPVIRKDEYGAILVFFKPGQYIPTHAPDSDLIFYVIEGKGKAQIGDNQVEIDKGSILVVPKGVKRGITAETYMEALHVVVPAPSPEDHEKVMEAAARGIREVQLKG
ncbi:MAG: cupin domain-containing protein, partial [Metallosphaera sp.]